MIESWRMVWRNGLSPLFSTPTLETLRKALIEDDTRLIQGATSIPPPLQCVQDWPVEAACVIGYCGWQGEGLETVAEVEEYFAKMCFEIDQKISEPAACHWFINWFDDNPRDFVRKELLEEVVRSLNERYFQESEQPIIINFKEFL